MPHPYSEIVEKCFENLIRVDSVIFLPGVFNCDSLPSGVEDFFESIDEKDFKQIFGQCPKWIKESLESEDYSGILEWLNDNQFYGFVIQVSTPVMQGDGDSTYFTWGRCYSAWVYGNTIEDAMEAAFTWQESKA